MDTYFAPPERSNDEQLRAEIELISKNAVIDGLLHSASGLLAILNEHRQILALNDSLLEALGCNNVDEALGLRPGEALKCVHSSDTPNGCGTGEWVFNADMTEITLCDSACTTVRNDAMARLEVKFGCIIPQ